MKSKLAMENIKFILRLCQVSFLFLNLAITQIEYPAGLAHTHRCSACIWAAVSAVTPYFFSYIFLRRSENHSYRVTNASFLWCLTVAVKQNKKH